MGKKELVEKLKAALMAARTLCDAVDQAKRDFTPEERQKLEGHLEEAKGLKAQLKQAEGDDAMRKALEDLGAGIAFQAGGRGLQEHALGGKGTIGEQFVTAPAFAEWLKSFPEGRIPDSAKGIRSPAIEIKGVWQRLQGRKTLITGDSDTSAGAFVETDYTGIYEPLGRSPRNVLDLVARRTTKSDLVQFVRQTARVTQAATVPEANVTTYAGSTGEVSGLKPEAAMAFEMVTEPVKTIAVWIPATKRALSDAGQIRGIIDQELRDDTLEELEDQMVNGDGVGENFTGILNTSGILTQAWDTDILTTTRKAKTLIRVTGWATPTAWVLNPEDWETLELEQDQEGRYRWGGPLANGTPTLWGIPIVESERVASGTGLLGNWNKAVFWDREQAALQVSDSHEDFFIRNMVAFLKELRGAFGLIRPSAFVEVELTSGS